MTRITIVFFLALTLAGCAGNRHATGPVVPANYVTEELDEVADVPWDRCDGECRYQESMRICSTTVQVAGVQRQQAHAAFMQFRDRTAFRARVMQSCRGGVRYAGNYRSPGIRRGNPICPTGQTFKPEYGKCVGSVLHPIPLSDERKEYYVGCPKFEYRFVVRGNRLVKQQRCAPQETRARS